jgi:hypothetical protein
MRLWPALFVPPLAFLSTLAAAYALVPWACATQRHFPIHLLALGCLAITIAGIVLALRDWRSAGLVEPDDGPDKAVQVRFIAVLALMLSGLIAVSTLTLWITTWIVPPCVR